MTINWPKEIKYRVILCIPILLLAIAIPIFSHQGTLIPADESLASWFQRSGSITVLLSILIELVLLSAQQYPGLTGSFDKGDKLTIIYKIIVYTTFLVLITGTIIWEYGDLLISC